MKPPCNPFSTPALASCMLQSWCTCMLGIMQAVTVCKPVCLSLRS